METALSVKNKLGFFGTLILTPSMAKEPLVAQAWTCCNNIVVTWILNFVSPRTATIRLNLFNHVLALFCAKFICISAIRYPIFMWE